ncbi:hypothetical protein CUR178_02589 [Leishmania enriettii]|uniref:Calpain catalytic domain-containing protein n=1 Tax=Leishmania enriettii TaxID=5663 RepID=A0A836GGY5_LEIEN|nr:hypothetical protein CUR178_02589 [Leishmania enriettii]
MDRQARAKRLRETQGIAGVAGVSHSGEELLYRCRKSDIAFIDMSFPPSEASLRRPRDEKSVACMNSIVWKRPHDYLPPMVHKEMRLLRHNVGVDGIAHCRRGDCWLMCAIAVVAESKTMIRDIFRRSSNNPWHRKEERVGGYRLCIGKNGWFLNFIVGSYLTTYNRGLYFAHST